eukprot:CAMPEP_0182858756 /NCGR_PEP_ID=MMETSP0034_2-20130328/3869_1 /TAXON_ID=156128 /ORGANISM="Nephroselmis pyriformis, Strain CCMP717" /LENGTH=44 /DNA_ID= /DNA_START= /DNA_END= /DNA_ORIENTATION=
MSPCSSDTSRPRSCGLSAAGQGGGAKGGAKGGCGALQGSKLGPR